jgi:hypothetical protein
LNQLPPALAQAIEDAQRNPTDLGALFRLGALMIDFGMIEQAMALRARLAEMIAAAIEAGAHPDMVMEALLVYYANFAKRIETEQNVRECFQLLIQPVAALGRSLRVPGLPRPLHAPTPQRPWRAGFMLQTPALLGHTRAMLEILQHRPRGMPWSDEAEVFVLDDAGVSAAIIDDQLGSLVRQAGARLVNVQAESGTTGPQRLARLQWLRQHIADTGLTHLVRVSAPILSDLAFCMGMAPAQALWTLKFHPYRLPEVDGYLTYGSWFETERIEHGETWQVVPQVFSQISAPVDPERVAEQRRRFAQHSLLFGTLARDEKFNSTTFLDAVVRILRDNPQAGYLWTGRERHRGVVAHFTAAGVIDRCHFIGWVDTALFARVLDVFLETFPFGCGVTGLQALEAGTALLSYAAPETIHGMYFARPLAAGGEGAATIRRLLAPTDGSGPLLYPATVDEYVALANRLAADAAFRRAVGDAGQAYFRASLTDSARMSARFFSVLADCKQPEPEAA